MATPANAVTPTRTWRRFPNQTTATSVGSIWLSITLTPSDSSARRRICLRSRIVAEEDDLPYLDDDNHRHNLIVVTAESRVVDFPTGDQLENYYVSAMWEAYNDVVTMLVISYPSPDLLSSVLRLYEQEMHSFFNDSIQQAMSSINDVQVELVYALGLLARTRTRARASQDVHRYCSSNTAVPAQQLVRGKYEDVRGNFEEECSICLEKFSKGDDSTEAARLPCSHVFHSHCVLRWLEQNRSCPLCRCSVPLLPLQ